MKVKELFQDGEEITIESYLEKCGVDNVGEYLKGNSIESTEHYENIDEWCNVLNKYMKEGGSNINQE